MTRPSSQPLRILAAGSLTAVLTEYAATLAIQPNLAFGPAGLLCQEIRRGRACDIYLSANTGHPASLGDAVQVFAYNPIRIVAQRELGLRADTLIEQLLDPALRLGTSTPGADPSGDYAQALFDRADQARPGCGALLRAKALQVVGATIPPVGGPTKENGIANLFADGAIDAFICYRSSAQRLVNLLDVVVPPPPLDVVAAYGLIVLVPSRAATDFVSGLLAASGQAVLARHGFDPRDAG